MLALRSNFQTVFSLQSNHLKKLQMLEVSFEKKKGFADV